MKKTDRYAVAIKAICAATGLPAPEAEYRFDPIRKWRFDFAWPKLMIAIEVEGLNPRGYSGHTTVQGYVKDMEKYNAATVLGWRVLRYQPRDLLRKAFDDLIVLGVKR